MGDAIRAVIGAHEAGEGLGRGVGDRAEGMRAGLAEAADRQVDQLRVVGGQAVVAHAEPGGDAGAETLDQDVGLQREAAQDRLGGGLAQVQAQGALAAVEDQRHGGVAAIGHALAQAARPVALGRLHLDHLGAVQRQQHGAVRRGNALAEVEHAKAAKGEFMAHRDAPARGAEV